jgi:hypothetical protein
MGGVYSTSQRKEAHSSASAGQTLRGVISFKASARTRRIPHQFLGDLKTGLQKIMFAIDYPPTRKTRRRFLDLLKTTRSDGSRHHTSTPVVHIASREQQARGQQVAVRGTGQPGTVPSYCSYRLQISD